VWLVDRSSRVTAAGVIVAIQAGIAALSALVLWAFAARRRRFAHRVLFDRFAHHPGLWGLVLFVAAAALTVLAVELFHRRPWVPVALFVTEGVVVVASLLRARPIRSLLGLVLAGAVIVLVASSRQEFTRTPVPR
jgi:hypothetical protein